jgi:hypothetical protein
VLGDVRDVDQAVPEAKLRRDEWAASSLGRELRSCFLSSQDNSSLPNLVGLWCPKGTCTKKAHGPAQPLMLLGLP